MNTISPKGADFILHAEEKGRGRFPGSGRVNMMRYLVGRRANIRLIDWYMTKNDISPMHIPDQCVSAPIKLHTKVALNEGMQDPVRKDSEVW